MVSFAQPSFWQIKYLVNSLSKKNQKTSLTELHNLIAAFGYDAQVFYLRVLLESVPTTQQAGGKGSTQLLVLSSELKDMENEEQFGQVLCQAIADYKESITEEFLQTLCKATKIGLKSQLNLAAALLQSLPGQEGSRKEAAKFLRSKLRELNGQRQTKLSEALLHSLLALLKGCPSTEVEEVLEEKEREQLFKQLLDHHPDVDTSRGPLAGLLVVYRMRESRLSKQSDRKPVDVPILGYSYQEGVRACDLVEELGHHGNNTNSAQAIREILKEFPQLGNKGVAEIIAVALHFNQQADVNSMLVAGMATVTALGFQGLDQWTSPDTHKIWQTQPQLENWQPISVELVIDVCLSQVKMLKKHWDEVFCLVFDLPELRLTTKKSVEALVNAYKHATKNADFPLGPLLYKRKNSTAQLQFIKHAMSGLITPLDWTPFQALPAITGLPGADGNPGNAGPGGCWACLKLLEVLFELAEAEDYQVVRELFRVGTSLRPHAMLVGCCLAEDRSRGLMRAEILEKLAPTLFEPNGGPNALLATVALAKHNPKGLRRLLRAMLDKDPQHNLQKILNLLMNDNLKEFYADLLKEPSELVCRIVLASHAGPKENGVSLPDWLAKVLAEQKDAAAFKLVRFMKTRLQSGLPGQAATTHTPPPPLPANLDEVEVCRSFLQALTQALDQLTPEAARQVRDLEALAFQRHPRLSPPPAPAAPSRPPEPPAEPPLPPASAHPHAAPTQPPPTAPPPAPPEPKAAPQPAISPDEEAKKIFTNLFQRIQTPTEVAALLADYRRGEGNTYEVYRIAIDLLVAEIPQMYTYPPEEYMLALSIIAMLLDSGLLGSCEAAVQKSIMSKLRNPSDINDFNFQLTILNMLLDRIARWPQMCIELARMDVLARQLPPLGAYVTYAKQVVAAIPEELRSLPSLTRTELERFHQKLPTMPRQETVRVWDQKQRDFRPGTLAPYLQGGQEERREVPPGPPPAKAQPPGMMAPPQNPPPPPPTRQPPKAAAPQGPGPRPQTVDQLLSEPEVPLSIPPQAVQDSVAAIFNGLSTDNLLDKVEQLQRVVTPEHYRWLCYYTVSRRATREANFHGNYIALFNACKERKVLFGQLIIMTFECLRLMMKAVDEAVHSSNHRQVLKSLGSWLGQITIGRDVPLKSKSMDVKDLLLDAYENSRLTAVLPMACKILEAIEKSRAFKLPSPWTMGLLMLLAEIHCVPNLKTNLMFEVEVLFRHLELEINAFPKSDLLRTRRSPMGGVDMGTARPAPQEPEVPAISQRHAHAAGYTAWGEAARQELDYRQPSSGAYATRQHSYQTQMQMDRARAAGGLDDFITPSLPQMVNVPSQFSVFRSGGAKLVMWLATGVDRAVKEVLHAVMEQSVTIACYSSAHLALKDFVFEVEEDLLRKAAGYMCVSVANSLALVMCCEPLKLALQSHLWHLFMQNFCVKDLPAMEGQVLESVINVLVEKNMDLCCMLVQKVVADKAAESLESFIAPYLDHRTEHKARYPHTMFCDNHVPQSPWLQQIPDHLKPVPGNLSHMFLKIYKDFQVDVAGFQARLPQGLAGERMNIVRDSRYLYQNQDQHYHQYKQQVQSLRLHNQQQQYAAAMRGQARRPEEVAAATTQAPARGDIREVAQQIISRVENMINFFTENPLRLASLSTLPHYLHCPDDTLEAVAALLALPIDSEFPKLLRGILRWIPAAAADNNVCTFMSKKLLQMLNVQYSKSEQTQTPPDCVSIMHLVSEIILCTMDTLASTAHMRKLMSETLLKLLDDMEGAGMIQLDIVAGILRYRLVNCGDFDRMMVRWVERGRTSSSMINVPQLDFVHLLLQRCCLEHRTHYGIDFPRCCEQFMKTAERRRRMNTQQAQQLQPQELQILQQTERIMESLTQQLQLADEEPTALESRPPSRLCVTSRYTEKDKEDRPGKMSFSEETAAKFIAEWHEAVKTNSDTPPSLEHMGTAQNRLVGNMLTKVMQMLLSTNSFHEDICELFFKYACESVVKVTLQDARPEEAKRQAEGASSRPAPVQLNFGYIDSFAYLIVTMMKKPHDPSGRFIDRPFSYNQQAMPVLRCALQGITKALVNNAKEKGEEFNQRVWYRLLMNLMLDTACNSQDMSWKILQGFADTYLALNPVRVPNFAYAWLDLISNKMFMPRILNFTGRRGWLLFFRIFMGLLNFIGPYLARIRMSDNIKNLYICTLRTLLVLLHDFPEFLSDYHMAFCDVIPWQCVQIRNLILAAFPSSMKLPDPFTQSLKVDMLPEVKVTPTINSTYLSRIMVCGLKADIDSFIRTRDKSILENIRKKLLADPKLAIETGTKYNIPLLNATILYAGANCNLFLQAKHLQTPQGGVPAQDQQIPSLELFWSLLENFDTEGRFLMFTTFANHLRFPNMHTHCFSCIVLWLFHDAKIPEVREQITRVLLERLIVHRPHPWGLLITFIELIKNRRYNFWNYPFVQSDPQLQKLFTSVAFTCLGQPVPKDDENLDLDGQLKYLQNYRFLDAAHQQLRQQQLDAASQQQQMAQQRVQAQAQAQVQQVQQAAALVQNVAHNPPQEAPPGPPQAAQPKPKAVPANAAANAGPPKGPPLTPPPVPPPAPQ